MGFPGGSDSKEFACNAGDPSLIPGLGRAPGGGNGNPLHYSCLESSMDRGTLWATVHEVTKSLTKLSDEHCTLYYIECSCSVTSAVSDSLQPHGLQPTRLPCPQDFPGKSTGVGCRHLLRQMALVVKNTPANTRDLRDVV